MINIKILYFAIFRQRTGLRSEEIQMLPGSCVGDLKVYLQEKYSILPVEINSVLVAINKEFAFDVDLLPDGGEIAIFPPVSGGDKDSRTIIRITSEETNINTLISQITYPTTGACCIFSGIVRAVTQNRNDQETHALEYEAYQEMAEDKMNKVVQEIRGLWPLVEGIALIQRVGLINAGDQTIVIACTGPHRNSGVFEAAHYGIDRLKEIVPVWKKEIGPMHADWVTGHYYPKPGD